MLKFLVLTSIIFQIHVAFGVINGSIAKVSEGKGVFQIGFEEANSGLCTAIKVGPKFFITAAHCFEGKILTKRMGFSTRIKNEALEFTTLEIEKVHIHPAYLESLKSNDGMGAMDLALVVVKKGPSFDKLAVREISFDFVGPQTRIEFWGFGSLVKNRGVSVVQPKEQLQGEFGAATTMVHENADLLDQCNFFTVGMNLSKSASSVSLGDSGGPVFLEGKLVGINYSFLTRNMDDDGHSDSLGTDLNLHVRLSAAKDWVLKILSKNN